MISDMSFGSRETPERRWRDARPRVSRTMRKIVQSALPFGVKSLGLKFGLAALRAFVVSLALRRILDAHTVARRITLSLRHRSHVRSEDQLQTRQSVTTCHGPDAAPHRPSQRSAANPRRSVA